VKSGRGKGPENGSFNLEAQKPKSEEAFEMNH